MLWIDAICINQSSMEERGHQVQLMGDVYSKAQRTWIWLGESTPESDYMMDLFKEYHDLLETCRRYPGHQDEILQPKINELRGQRQNSPRP